MKYIEKKKRRIRHLFTRGPIFRAKMFIQRGRQGYSTEDTWSFDSYLAEVIAGGLTELRGRNISHPMRFSPEEWLDILDKIIAGFSQYDDWHFYLDPQGPKEMKIALKLFKKYYGSFWD